MLARDRLIVCYQVDSILERLTRTEMIIVDTIIANIMMWLSQ
jgi:hypothetical protein